MRTIIIDTKKSVIRDIRTSIITDAFILLGFFILGMFGFLISFNSVAFDKFMIAGFVVVGIKGIWKLIKNAEYNSLRDKVMNISVSTGLITFKNSPTTSLVIDMREVLDGPIFKITRKLHYTIIEVIPDGCKNAEKIYELTHRLEEQFHMTAELQDNRYSAIYVLRDESKTGRKLNHNDFR